MLQKILNWSEVWALLIPLTIWFIKKPKANWTKPLIWYIVIAFLLNSMADVLWQRRHLGIEGWLQKNFAFLFEVDGKTLKNTLLYNLHSISRFLFFAWFFNYLDKVFKKINIIVPALFFMLVIINFTISENIKNFSSWLLAAEAALLLFYCILYYLSTLKEETTFEKRPPVFWVVTGLGIYVVINFPIFLFYTNLAKQFKYFAVSLWDLHNITYIILCIFIAKAFYESEQ